VNSQTPKFCSNCGSALSPNARFCGTCGAQLALTQPAPPPPPAYAPPLPPYTPPAPIPAAQNPSEPIIATLSGLNRRKGLFGAESFNLLVTPQRMVFAYVTSEMLKWAAEQAKQNAKQQGKGFFGQWGAVIGANNFLLDRCRAMPIENILAENQENFVIYNQQVQSIKARANFDPDTNQPDTMEIRFSGGKMKFDLSGCNAGEVKKVLKPVFGSLVK
jgi:hypothetical protein